MKKCLFESFGHFILYGFIFIYLLAALDLCCYLWALSSCSEQAAPWLWCVGFLLQWLPLSLSTNSGARAQSLRCTVLVASRPVASSRTRDPACVLCTAGRLSTTGPSEKCCWAILKLCCLSFSFRVVKSHYIFWILTLIQCMILSIFFLFCRFSFHFLDNALLCTEFQYVDEVQFIFFKFHCCSFGVVSKNPLSNPS